MKVKQITLVTPVGRIDMPGSDEERTEDEFDELLKGWEVILMNSKYLKFSTEGKAYFLPEQVLKNTYVEITHEGMSCEEN